MTALAYWNIVTSMVNDPCHEFLNMVVMMLLLVSNEGQFKYKQGRRAVEETYSRFPNGPTWKAKTSDMKYVDRLCMTQGLPTPWTKMKKIFAHTSHLKIHHAIMLCGPIGIYMFAQLGLNPVIFAMIRDLFRVMEFYTSKGYDRAHLPLWARRLKEVLARMETLLPLYCCTIVMHILSHLATHLGRAGPMHACGMLCYERFHTLMHSLARGSKNLLRSIAVHYCRFLMAQGWRGSGALDPDGGRVGIRPDTPTMPYWHTADWNEDGSWICKGDLGYMELDDLRFNHLLEIWGDVNPVLICVCVF
jgi:hypothetical protein